MTPEQEIRAAALDATTKALGFDMLEWSTYKYSNFPDRVDDISKDGWYVLSLFEEYIKHGLKERDE